MKKLTPWLISAALAALLFFQWRCNKVSVPAIDTHAIDSVAHANDSTIALYKDSVVILQLQINNNDIERNREIVAKEDLERRMTDKIAMLTFSINKYRTAKESKDTAQQLVNCDDIVLALDSIYGQAMLYKATIDSLQANGGNRRQLDSTGMAMRDRTIADLQGQVQALQKFLMDAVHDNNDLRMALKRTKRGRWALVGLAAIGGFFLSNQLK